jgi:exodeoxyribonuclease-5
MPEQYADILRLAVRRFDEATELLRALMRQRLEPGRKQKVADLVALARTAAQKAPIRERGITKVWSPQQDKALGAIRRWLREHDRQLFRLFGYAGTGKTEIAKAIGMEYPYTTFAAFTGKAAHVLKQRGCEPVSTIHKLIYNTTFDEKLGLFFHELKPRDELTGVRLIILDEASMISEMLAKELLSFGQQILIIADPFQLPPVDGSRNGYFVQEEPDAMLTEVHRQARDNPILELAHRIREGGTLLRTGYRADGLRITNTEQDITEHDIVFVRTNDSRHVHNRRLRYQFGFAPRQNGQIEPQIGETVCCLRNCYRVEEAVLNGALYQIKSSVHVGDADIPILQLGLTSKYNGKSTVAVPVECFTDKRFQFYRDLQQFDYGYALTVHKAQGSEWDSVMLINEPSYFDDDEARRRWLYTGITRARKRLTLVDYS